MIFHRNQNSDGHKSSRVWLSVYDLGSRSHCIIKNESVLEQKRAVVMPVVAHKPVSHRVFGPISSSLSVNGSYYFNNGVANATSNGAPTMTPIAYTDIKCPAVVMLMLNHLRYPEAAPSLQTPSFLFQNRLTPGISCFFNFLSSVIHRYVRSDHLTSLSIYLNKRQLS